MSEQTMPAPEDLASLRRQLESLAQQVAALEQRLSAGTSGGAAGPKAEIPWLVIMAAVAAVIREPHRIVSLQIPGLPPVNLWSIEGRRAVFHSHRVR
jgi:hypothetical protein